MNLPWVQSRVTMRGFFLHDEERIDTVNTTDRYSIG